MAAELALEYQIDPDEALLLVVRRRAARVAWVDGIIALMVAEHLAKGEDHTMANLPSTVRSWMAESRKEEALMGRAAKAALDAEVAERVVRQLELEGRLVAAAVSAGLDALELTVDQRITALQQAHATLLELEAKATPEPDDHGGLPPLNGD
jgi:hypothetical protein